MRSTQCGTISELTAMRYYVEQGYSLFLPYDHDTSVDFIAQRGTQMIRVQVKTATTRRNNGCSYLGAEVAGYKPEDFDELFVVDTRNVRMWRIPWATLGLKAELITLNRVDSDGRPRPYAKRSPKRIDTDQWRVDAPD
jgi:hypothetical protein